jgi:glycosyltransferase involved in cell wall biosynthesis
MAKIAIDATYTVDPQPSGVATYSRKLIEALATLPTGHHFLLCYRLSRFQSRHEFLRPVPPAQRTQPRFSVRFYQEPLTFWLPRQATLFHSLAQRPPAFRFQKEVVTVHDVFPLLGRDYCTPEFQRKFSALLLEAAERATRVIAVSQYTADQLVACAGVPREKITVVHEGVDQPGTMLASPERLVQREHLVGQGNEMVLSVGVLQTRKNTINMLKAISSLPAQYRLVLVGGDGYGSEAIHEFVRRERLEWRVIRLGHVPRERLAVLYQAASVFLFPSWEEGFGLPVLEAMAHELPVVVANASSLPEVAGDAALYVNPSDPHDIADKVTRAVEDLALREALIQRGLGRARQFTWRATAEQTVAVYEEILATR